MKMLQKIICICITPPQNLCLHPLFICTKHYRSGMLMQSHSLYPVFEPLHTVQGPWLNLLPQPYTCRPPDDCEYECDSNIECCKALSLLFLSSCLVIQVGFFFYFLFILLPPPQYENISDNHEAQASYSQVLISISLLRVRRSSWNFYLQSHFMI